MINKKATPDKAGSLIYFLISLGLISVLLFTFFFSVSGFFLHIGISWWQFPLACLVALTISYFAARTFKAQFLKITIIITLLVTASIGVAGYFYDVSFDGQWYHQEDVYQMKEGFNPVYQAYIIPAEEMATKNNWCAPDSKSPQAQANDKPVVNMKYLALNYFAKGAEISASAIYGFTNRIETGKAVNIIMLFASFFLCLSVLEKFEQIKPWFRWLLAIILAFNPITSNELLSFCVDGFGGSALLSLLAIFALLLISYNRWLLYLLFAVIILTVNVKATMLAFTIVFCAAFVLVIALRKDQWYKLKSIMITGFIAGVIGVLVFGFNPYVTTYKRQHSVFYGLADVKNEIDRLTPVPLRGHNGLAKLLFSVSSHAGWSAKEEVSGLTGIAKIPFSINKTDLLESADIEVPLCGFGPFFSGALIIAVIAFVIAAIKNGRSGVFLFAGLTLLVLFITILVVPDSWWARFVPQMWLLPAVVLLMLCFLNYKGSGVLKFALTAAMLLNVVWGSMIFGISILNNAFIDHQLAQLKALNKPVYMEYCDYRNFNINKIRLTEAGIPLTTDPVAGDNEYDLAFSTTRIQVPGPLPEVPAGILFKLRSKLAAGTK